MSTRAEILAEIAAQFPDNTTGLITPAKLRQVVEDITNSYNNSTDEGTPAATTAAHNADPAAHLDEIARRVESGGSTPAISVVFICDDGSDVEYRDIRPIFAARGVPCCAALLSSITEPRLSEYLTLQDSGWEILSHSATHAHLDTLTTDAEVIAELSGSKTQLSAKGFNVESFVIPYGGTNERVRRLLPDYYYAAATSFGDPTNAEPIGMMGVSRYSLGYGAAANTLDYTKAPVLAAQAVGSGLIVYALHPSAAGHDATTNQNIADLLDWLATQSIPVRRFTDAIKLHGNKVQLGDAPSKLSDPTKSGTSSLAFSRRRGLIQLRNVLINYGDPVDYGFQRFGHRATLQGVTSVVGRMIMMSAGSTARFIGNSGSNSSDYFAATEMHRGTAASSWANIVGPAYAVGGARSLWVRWKQATAFGGPSSDGYLAFFGLRQEQQITVAGMQNAAGFLVSSANTNVLAGIKVAGAWTTIDTGIPITSYGYYIDTAIELTATAALFYVSGKLIGTLPHTFTSGFSMAIGIDGPTTGANDGLLAIRSCEWGYGIPFA